MSLFDIPPIEPEPVVAPAPRPEYGVILKQTRSGRDILVCTATVAPAEVIADAEAKGLPLFTGGEIVRMKACPAEMVDHIIQVKLMYPGCTVEQILNGGAAG